MKKYLLILGLIFTYQVNAQDTPATHKNIIKLNLTAVVVNNYSLQYERILNKKSSAAISIRYMPVSELPFKSIIRKAVADEDPELRNTIEQLEIGNFAITPEYRIYLGKSGYGRGFYLGPFYRFANFKTNNVIITYDGDILGNDETVVLNGDLNSHTFGIIVGAQWKLGKNIYLDWNIAGPHIGSGNGELTGLSSRTLSESEQDRVREELENLDIPFTRKTISVNSQGANMKLDGPWGGVRAGLSLGIGF